MEESVVNFVTFSKFLEPNLEYYAHCYGTEILTKEWQEKNIFTFEDIRNAITNRRNLFKLFLDNVNKGEYYFFITNKVQQPVMEATILKYDLDKHLVWSSKQPATNLMHKDVGPSLKCWLFLF